jgi:hypothetical protein
MERLCHLVRDERWKRSVATPLTPRSVTLGDESAVKHYLAHPRYRGGVLCRTLSFFRNEAPFPLAQIWFLLILWIYGKGVWGLGGWW